MSPTQCNYNESNEWKREAGEPGSGELRINDDVIAGWYFRPCWLLETEARKTRAWIMVILLVPWKGTQPCHHLGFSSQKGFQASDPHKHKVMNWSCLLAVQFMAVCTAGREKWYKNELAHCCCSCHSWAWTSWSTGWMGTGTSHVLLELLDCQRLGVSDLLAQQKYWWNSQKSHRHSHTVHPTLTISCGPLRAMLWIFFSLGPRGDNDIRKQGSWKVVVITGTQTVLCTDGPCSYGGNLSYCPISFRNPFLLQGSLDELVRGLQMEATPEHTPRGVAFKRPGLCCHWQLQGWVYFLPWLCLLCVVPSFCLPVYLFPFKWEVTN